MIVSAKKPSVVPPAMRTGPRRRRAAGLDRRHRRTRTATVSATITNPSPSKITESTASAVELSEIRNAFSGQSMQPPLAGVASKSIGTVFARKAAAYAAITSARSQRDWSRPLGYASSRCTSAAMKIAPSAIPIVNRIELFASLSAPTKNVKPTTIIRMPVRFSGLRVRAISPATTNDHPTSSPKTLTRIRFSSCPLVNTAASAPPPAASARGPTISQTRDADLIPKA